MGDHFWPALYPGLIVGLLFGLSLRGVWNAVSGMLGGLLGAAAAVLALEETAHTNGFISVAFTIAGAAIGAYATLSLVRTFRRP